MEVYGANNTHPCIYYVTASPFLSQSPSIIVRESFSIYADVNSQVQGLTITDREDDISTVSIVRHMSI